jgi:hypothetical protein
LVFKCCTNLLTLQPSSGYVAPNLTQLGGFYSVPYSAGTVNFVSNTAITYATYTITQPGYYLFVATAICYTSSLVNTYNQAYILDNTNSKYIAYVAYPTTSTTSSTIAFNLSGFYQITNTTTVILQLVLQFSSGSATTTSGAYNYYIIRIA